MDPLLLLILAVILLAIAFLVPDTTVRMFLAVGALIASIVAAVLVL